MSTPKRLPRCSQDGGEPGSSFLHVAPFSVALLVGFVVEPSPAPSSMCALTTEPACDGTGSAALEDMCSSFVDKDFVSLCPADLMPIADGASISCGIGTECDVATCCVEGEWVWLLSRRLRTKTGSLTINKWEGS